MIEPKIFRAYDIRGTYPDQIDAKAAELIGKGFGTYLISNLKLRITNSNLKVVVGRDVRTHGEELYDAFIKGLTSTGCDYIDLAVSPSPFMYFVNSYFDFDAGCEITASHNPKEYNGFKLVTKHAHAVFGDELQIIREIIEKGEFAEGNGEKVDFHDPYGEYFEKLKSLFPYSKKLKVVVDSANGVAGNLYPQVIRNLGHEVVELFCELDGTFPNHEPDPIVEENLEELKKRVLEENADMGIAFDGDGDRVGIVTEKGKFINADQVLMMLSKDVLIRHPGKAIVFTVSNSQSLFELVKEWGGNPVMCKVGHSYVEDAMTEHDAILGGEQSGHFFLPEDYYPYDDALVTALRILKISCDKNQSISEIIDEFPKAYAVPEMRPYCSDDEKFEILDKITNYFKDKYPNSTLDGIRLDFGNGGWAGIRVSNTSPCISLTMEAQTEEHLDEIKNIILSHIKTYSEIKI